ncbi:reverse transcriptase domain-containing protein, partial [Tanacetum coccineum]
VEFKRISLTGFHSCTSRSRYRSVSKQTTRISIVIVNIMRYHSDVLIPPVLAGSWEQIPILNHLITSIKIMPPRMTTRSAGRATIAPRGGRTCGQVGGQGNEVNVGVDGVPDFSTIIAQQLHNLLPTILAQVGNQGSNQGNPRNQNGDAINDNIKGDVRNVIVNNNRRGCTYKEFLACNPKEYDGKGGDIVYTRWIEKIESVQDMSGCEENQKVKYTAGSFVDKDLTWWNSQIHTRSREVAVGMSWKDFKNLIREEFSLFNEMQKLETAFWNHVMVRAGHAAYTDRVHELARLVPHLKDGTLTDEAIRNGSLKKNPKKKGNGGEPNRDRNARDENKRTMTGNAFATTTNPVRREYNGTIPKCVSCNLYHPPEMPCRACFNCSRPRHMAKDCRVAPRMVNPVNARNPTAAPGACYEYGGTDHFKVACPRLNQAQRPGGNRPNQVVANNEGQGVYAGSRGGSLGPEHHDGGSFDVIVGMDWLSNHKAKIICYEKVVRISQQDGQLLRVIGERPEEKMRHLMSAKAKQKQEENVVVRDFPEEYRSRNLPIDWHLLKWRSCRVNLKNSKTRVSFDQARPLGEHRYYLLRRKMVPLECALIIES